MFPDSRRGKKCVKNHAICSQFKELKPHYSEAKHDFALIWTFDAISFVPLWVQFLSVYKLKDIRVIADDDKRKYYLHDCLITWFVWFYSSNYSLKCCRQHSGYSASLNLSQSLYLGGTGALFRGYVYELHQTLTQFLNQTHCSLSPIMKRDILVLWRNTKSWMRVLLTAKYYRQQQQDLDLWK